MLVDTDIVIFGGHGDLSVKKLIPSLFSLFTHQLLSSHSQIILITRSPYTANEHDAFLATILAKYIHDKSVSAFIEKVSFLTMDITQVEAYDSLAQCLRTSKNSHSVFYLSIAASLYQTVCRNLDEHDLVHTASKVVLEKPTGNNLESFKEITHAVYGLFDKETIFFIDHYLGKDAVSNILHLRFANTFLAQSWNNRAIDHIQISLLEDVGVGQRLGFYNDYGATLDMVQNHILQILCLLVMDAPHALSSEAINDARVKVLESLKIIDESKISSHTVRGRYISDYSNDITTETFVAMKLELEHDTWQGVPIYIRTGKRMSVKKSEAVIVFKDTTNELFTGSAPNVLRINLSSREDIQLLLGVKSAVSESSDEVIQSLWCPRDDKIHAYYPNSYERMLFDVIQNHKELFVREDVIEKSWVWVDKIMQAWHHTDAPIVDYEVGSDGPHSAYELIENDNRHWNN